MLASAVTTVAHLDAIAVVGDEDHSTFSAGVAPRARLLASMTATIDDTAIGKAVKVSLVNIDVASDLDGVFATRNSLVHGHPAKHHAWILNFEATQTSLLVSARQSALNVFDNDLAERVAFFTTWVWADMLAALPRPRARLHAVEGSMEHLGMALRNARVTAVKLLVAEKIASSFWRQSSKVIWALNPHWPILVARTAKL